MPVAALHQQFWESAGPPVVITGPVSLDSFDLEMGNNGGAFQTPKFAVGKFGGSTWLSVASDTRATEPIVASYGITGDALTDLVASPGSLTWALNNAEDNTFQTLGLYSPLHPARRTAFDWDVPIRWSLVYQSRRYYAFVGKLANTQVVPGIQGERIVHLQAEDAMADWMRLPTPQLPVQINKRDDEIIAALLDELESQPVRGTMQAGVDTYPLALDNAFEDQVTIRESIIDVCRSGFSKLAIIGDGYTGGVVRLWNRQDEARNTEVLYHIDNDIDLTSDALVVPGSREDLVKRIKVTVRDTRVDATATATLYSIDTASILVGPRYQTVTGISGTFRDPSQVSQRVAGIDMQPAVPPTDFTMNSQQDGLGEDLTAFLMVTAAYTATTVRWTLVNTHLSLPGWVFGLQCRGRGVYRNDVIIEKSTTSKYADREIAFEMTYQDSIAVGQSCAEYFATVLSRPMRRVKSYTFNANKTHTRMTQALTREPGDRIAITEPVVGLDADEFIIRWKRLEMRENKTLWCTWGLAQADMTRVWISDQPGASEADLTTVAGW